jgi:TetR/AcrR family transcriptional regulator
MAKASATSPPPAPTRRRRPSVDITTDLLDAAAIEFAAHGFDGASTRRIAGRAGAHQPQINYHFDSKEHLWQETVTRLFDLMEIEGDVGTGGRDLVHTLAETLRRFIHFSAEHPELNRIINLEATAPSLRLAWLTSTHLRPLYELMDVTWTEIRAAGAGADLTTAEVWELTTGFGALHFANEPMHEMLGISSGTGRAEADRHADRLLALLVPGLEA